MNDVAAAARVSGKIAGFWRRLGALAFDLLLLLVVGMGLGALLFDPLARMGSWARVIGFAIALAYFGIGNSRLAEGQTFGKYGFGLRVVDGGGGLLSVQRSLLRYTVLGLPFFLNGLPVAPSLPGLEYLLALIVFGGVLCIVYLYIFNRRTRQSSHDLVANSLVVRATPDGEPEVRPMPGPRVWRGHLVAAALLGLIGLASPTVLRRFSDREILADLIPMQRALASRQHALAVQMMRTRFYGGGDGMQYLKARVHLDAPMLDDAEMARSMAQQMKTMDSDPAAEDAILVDLSYGYDMIIASSWTMRRFMFMTADL
jgi:uncharacterized RDD family membrane protein YckC